MYILWGRGYINFNPPAQIVGKMILKIEFLIYKIPWKTKTTNLSSTIIPTFMNQISTINEDLQEITPISIKCTHECIAAICNAITTAANTAIQQHSLIGIDEYLSHFGETHGIPFDTITRMQIAVSNYIRALGYER